MGVTDYVIDILLIAVIFRQVRPHELTLRSVLLPLVLLAAAGILYLRPLALRGNDVAFIVVLAAAGAVLGALSGRADAIWRDRRGRLLSGPARYQWGRGSSAWGSASGLPITPITPVAARLPGSLLPMTSPAPGSGRPRWSSWPSGRCSRG